MAPKRPRFPAHVQGVTLRIDATFYYFPLAKLLKSGYAPWRGKAELGRGDMTIPFAPPHATVVPASHACELEQAPCPRCGIASELVQYHAGTDEWLCQRCFADQAMGANRPRTELL